MKGHRVWKITKAIGVGAGVPEIHPHAFRHSSGVELLRLTRELQSLFEPVLQSRSRFRQFDPVVRPRPAEQEQAGARARREGRTGERGPGEGAPLDADTSP